MLETLPNQPRGYGAAGRARLGEDRGPACINLPNPPWSQANPVRRQPNFNDGVDEPTGKGTSRVAPGYAARRRATPAAAEEADLLRACSARRSGVTADDVPDLGAAPRRARWRAGAEVSAAMKLLDKKTTGDLVKLIIFIVVTTLATGVLVTTIGNISLRRQREYKAEFVDATGVVKGDDVRIAGVKVGHGQGASRSTTAPAPW